MGYCLIITIQEEIRQINTKPRYGKENSYKSKYLKHVITERIDTISDLQNKLSP